MIWPFRLSGMANFFINRDDKYFYIYSMSFFLLIRNDPPVVFHNQPGIVISNDKSRENILSLPGKLILLLCFFFAFSQQVFAQPFTPVTVTGFNHDVIAETGTSSLTTTTIALDAVPASNRVMYTNAFRITNGFGGGGLPDNGLITNAGDNYQLADYAGNNALLLQRTQTGDLTLTTPAKFSTIRVLAFTTEGTSLVNVKLYFTDGTITNVLTNYGLPDWFNNAANLVISGFGRCTRATPASSPDGYPINPRMYYINIPLSCTDKLRTLEKINFTNVTTGGSNAPYPNSVFLGVSGVTNNPTISANITDATCTVNGSVTLMINGVSAPYTITWNTIPVQTGPTATNLPPGTYQATITDAGGCDTIFTVTIALINNLFMTVHNDTSICSGSSFNANTISNAATYSWSPATGVSNPNIANPVITPVATTTYTVTGTTGICTISKSFTVTFLQKAIAKFGFIVKPCSNDPVIFSDSSSVTGGTINLWHWVENGILFSTVQNPVVSFPAGTHTIGLVVSGTVGCTSDTVYQTFTITLKPLIGMVFKNACKQTPVNFTASDLNGTGITGWTWIFDDGSTANGTVATHTYPVNGNFPVKLVAVSASGCASDTLTSFIIIYGTSAYAGRDTTAAPWQPIQLNGSGGISYSWSPAQYLNNSNSQSPVAVVSKTQSFILKAFTPEGCESYDTVVIKVFDGPEIYLPNAFTPNGDGLNDTYRGIPIGIKDFKFLRIYNRYGQEIFATTDPAKGWNGTWKGARQESGIYVVVASGIDFRGNPVDKQGTVMLIR